MRRTGGCQCGNIRYECDDKDHNLYVCHCTNCQQQSSSAFGISFVVPSENLKLIQGEPSYYHWMTDTGNAKKGAFCPDCGVRLWHQSAVDDGEWVSVKGGTLDEQVDLSEVHHIWTRSKVPGVIIPENAKQFEKESD